MAEKGQQKHIDCCGKVQKMLHGDINDRTKDNEVSAGQVGKNQGRFLGAKRRQARRDSVREGPR